VNFYSSTEYLDVIAKLYFPRQETTVSNITIRGKIYRVLIVDGVPLVNHIFLDFHEPLNVVKAEEESRVYIPNASVGMVTASQFQGSDQYQQYQAAPTVIWDGFASFDDYLKCLGRIRKDDRRRERGIIKNIGPLQFAIHDQEPDVMASAFCWKSEQTRKTLGVDLFAEGRHREFFAELDHKGLLRASTLRADGRLLAVWLGVVYNKRWYGWVYTYDKNPLWSKFSVGRQLLYPMLKQSYDEKHNEFDFSIGGEGYKWPFATHARLIGPVGPRPIKQRIVNASKAVLTRLLGDESVEKYRKKKLDRQIAALPPPIPYKDNDDRNLPRR
jgi:hypothetical protein